jgi:membrane fusion protein, copper/silver efflux system
MSKMMKSGAAVLAVMASVAAGYRLGAGQWPTLAEAPGTTAAARGGSSPDGSGSRHETGTSAPRPESSERRVLYWKDPDGKSTYAANPAKTADGRDYVPVHDDQEPDFPENKTATPPKTVSGGGKKILYYRNPMGLPDTSPVPKKDWMGMDYIPVYEGEEDDGKTVKVSLDRVQRSGVRTAIAEMRTIARPVRAPGVAKPDERTLRVVTLRADGFIEALHVNETGRHVKAGDALFRVYSPQIVSAQVDYRTAVTTPGGPRDEQGARQRLKNLDLPEQVLRHLRANANPAMSIEWPAPVSGVVMEKKVVEGQMAKAGEELYRLADLSSIWVIADVAEQDLAQVKVGAPAAVSFRAFPNEPFEGRVSFILHELDMKTRTAKVRIEVKNPEHHIKHEMYAEVEINAGADDGPSLAVPVSAVIDSGRRQVVIVDRGEGRFEPRQVKLGLRGDGFVEVRDGVKDGEKVVVAANFLIDAESNLRAALSGFTADSPGPPAVKRSESGAASTREAEGSRSQRSSPAPRPSPVPRPSPTKLDGAEREKKPPAEAK